MFVASSSTSCHVGMYVSCDTSLLFDIFFQVGDKLPSIEVNENNPGEKVNIADLFKGKKGVLFAVPGAFTPGCSKVCCVIHYLLNM